MKSNRVAASFRDNFGSVYETDGRIFRSVEKAGAETYNSISKSGLLSDSIKAGFLIGSRSLRSEDWPTNLQHSVEVIEHDKLPFISYPYEWSFSQLKAAALHHLDFQVFLFDKGAVLRDASAYNIQFDGSTPVFIDLLSIKPYREGEYWMGYQQFCEQFLYPLLLGSINGLEHNAWYRGSLEGITASELSALLPLRGKLKPNVLMHVSAPARMHTSAIADDDAAVKKFNRRKPLAASSYRAILLQLRRWIEKLEFKGARKTTWGDYARENTYLKQESEAKARIICEFSARVSPRLLIDIGCNSGDYSFAALEGGAGYVVGFDFDRLAIEEAFRRSMTAGAKFLPIRIDSANPSPAQGWMQLERSGYADRAKADAMVALAFEHHLAIGRNVPLDQVTKWMVSHAPRGLIEFVPKSDPTVQKMLSFREDVFPDYDQESFANCLRNQASIRDVIGVSSSGRKIFEYERNA